MKTPDEIKDNARTCISQPYTEPCGSCKLYPKCRGDVNYNLIALLDLVNECERRLAQAERERDAAVRDLGDSCKYCKNTRNALDSYPCNECMQRKNEHLFAPVVRKKFEWRGVCEENSK